MGYAVTVCDGDGQHAAVVGQETAEATTSGHRRLGRADGIRIGVCGSGCYAALRHVLLR